MKIANKVNVSVLLIFFLCVIFGGGVAYSSYRNIRGEMYRWFDRSAENLAVKLSSEAMGYISYFDFDALSKMMASAAEDPNLLYLSIRHGKDLEETEEIGDREAGPFRTYSSASSEAGVVVAALDIHYGTRIVEDTLASFIRKISLGLAATAVILVSFIYLFVSVVVNRPLMKLVSTARTIADGDLSSRLGIRSGDEFELLGGTFDRMTDNLQGIIEKIRGVFSRVEKVSSDVATVSHTVAESATGQAVNIDNTSSSIEELNATIKSIVGSVENLFKSAEESTSSIIEMSASIDMVAGNADEVSTSVEQMSSSIEELNMSTQQIAEKSEELLNKTEESAAALTEMGQSIKEVEKSAREAKILSIEVTTSVSEEGREAVEKATVGMNHIREVVMEVSRTIETLGGKAAGIDKILDVIRDVAEQTNLLALNAAIISAQAGEHGRGFAVVAGEIRELAERTSLSVEEINTMIKDIQKEAANAVTVAQKGADSVEEGERLVADVGKTLKKAAVDSENSSNAAQMIAKATAEQAEGVRLVSATSSTMTQMSSEIARATREQTLGSEQIRMAVELIREKAMQVRTAMSEQSRGVKQISKSSEYATGMAKNILEASREEARSSELILKSAEEIRSSTIMNLSAVDSLKEMVSILAEQAALLKEELETFKTG